MPQPLTDQQIDTYAQLAIVADHGGAPVEPAIVTALVDEVRRLQQQKRFLFRQLAKRDAASGRADEAVRQFLAGE
ncbi:hypothetical protein [Streptomyces sp. NPDC101249]|uniref:hypothetical protein n=1 Tax=Streptomyces sp. NPDC101249 TaxID=3366140 RepID=UPI003807CB08